MSVVTLTGLAAEINREHAAALEHAQAAVNRACKAGELLLQAKKQCKHGEWLPWLATNCPDIAERTAQAYMRLASACIETPSMMMELESLSLTKALATITVPKSATALRISPAPPVDPSKAASVFIQTTGRRRRLDPHKLVVATIDTLSATFCGIQVLNELGAAFPAVTAQEGEEWLAILDKSTREINKLRKIIKQSVNSSAVAKVAS